MSEKFTCRCKRKLSPDYDKQVKEVRSSAFKLLLFESEIHLPEFKVKLSEFLERVIELTTPQPDGPRKFADLVDSEITWNITRRGMSPKQAVPCARRAVADVVNKSFAAVKLAHLRYGTASVTKKQKL